MSKKHNTKHDRSPSRYKLRLRKRGLAATPRMRWSHCDGAMSTDEIARELAAQQPTKRPSATADVRELKAMHEREAVR